MPILFSVSRYSHQIRCAITSSQQRIWASRFTHKFHVSRDWPPPLYRLPNLPLDHDILSGLSHSQRRRNVVHITRSTIYLPAQLELTAPSTAMLSLRQVLQAQANAVEQLTVERVERLAQETAGLNKCPRRLRGSRIPPPSMLSPRDMRARVPSVSTVRLCRLKLSLSRTHRLLG